MRSAKLIVIAAALVLFATACGGGGSNKVTTTTGIPSKHLSVVVTTTQLADFVNVVGGPQVTVYSILKPGDDPHNHTLTIADINAIGTANVIIKNGAGLEPWFDSSMATTEHTGAIVDASLGVTVLPSTDTHSPNGDPHIWMSVANAKLMVANVRQALSTADPGDADLYSSSERAYDAQLDAFINNASQALGALTNKNLVVDHQAFEYFCEEFSLNCAASVTPISDSQPTPSNAAIAATAGSLSGQSVLAVFAQPGASSSGAVQLAHDLGVKVVAGSNGLYGDSLGPPGSDADTYLKMMQHNLNAIVANLH